MPYIVSTVNVNGVRAAAGKGLLEWLSRTEADIVCLQETRADDTQIATALAPALDSGWQLAHAEPGVKGRAGVGVLSRRPARSVRVGIPDSAFLDTGRFIEVEFDEVTVASVYVHTGEAGSTKQDDKYRFLDELSAHLATRTETYIIAGDWNIAHTERDLKNWKGNLKKSGFLPEERAWLDRQFAAGWVDVVRKLHPEGDGPFSWWSYRGRAFDNDTGWRIDAVYATKDIASTVVSAVTEKAATYAERWSDHAPVTVGFDWPCRVPDSASVALAGVGGAE